MPQVGDTKVQCQFCSHYFVAGAGLTNHERGCSLNPARRPQKRRTRRLCPKCRTLVDAGNFNRHVQACPGRREEPLLIEDDPTPLPPVVDVERARQLHAALRADLPAPPRESTSELLVELLFPNGVMPTHPEFVRAFRAWLDATDKLVAIAGMDS